MTPVTPGMQRLSGALFSLLFFILPLLWFSTLLHGRWSKWDGLLLSSATIVCCFLYLQRRSFMIVVKGVGEGTIVIRMFYLISNGSTMLTWVFIAVTDDTQIHHIYDYLRALNFVPTIWDDSIYFLAGKRIASSQDSMRDLELRSLCTLEIRWRTLGGASASKDNSKCSIYLSAFRPKAKQPSHHCLQRPKGQTLDTGANRLMGVGTQRCVVLRGQEIPKKMKILTWPLRLVSLFSATSTASYDHVA